MTHELKVYEILQRHRVPFVVVGGHAVTFHGYLRTTEDIDVVWLRSADSEQAMLEALTEITACWLDSKIDPETELSAPFR